MSDVLILDDVQLIRDGRHLLDGVTWHVREGERWVVMGPNGCGKTSLMRIAALYEHPSSGEVTVRGERLGHTDVRRLRRRVALVSSALAEMIRPALLCRDVVMSARFAALEPWWHTYEPADAERAIRLLDEQGVGFATDRRFASLSSGEKQRVLLARALMGQPELVLLDEPCTGLDLRGREELVDHLSGLAKDPSSAPTALVTHHVEEIPPGFTHLLALRAGRIVASGELSETLTSDVRAETFDIQVTLARHNDGRFSARRA